MKYIVPILIITLAMHGCKRSGEEEFYGPVSVSGTVVDDVDGQPMRGARVTLDGMVQRSGPFGYFSEPEHLASVLTDSSGGYRISVEANGETSYSVSVDGGSQYLNAAVHGTQDYTFKGTGEHVLALRCFRHSTATIHLQNTGRRDPGSLHLLGPAGAVRLDNQIRDTVVYLKLVGNVSIPSRVSYSDGVNGTTMQDLRVAAGDTVHLRYEF